MGIRELILDMRLAGGLDDPGAGQAVSHYVRCIRPTNDKLSAWQKFERRCDKLVDSVELSRRQHMARLLVAGLESVTAQKALTPLGEAMSRKRWRLRDILAEGGATQDRVYRDAAPGAPQLWQAWQDGHAWALGWLVTHGVPIDDKLMAAALAGTRSTLITPFVWAQPSTAKALQAFGLSTQGETFACEPIAELSPDHIFVCDNGRVLDVHELLRYVLTQRAFTNPYGGPLSRNEVHILCSHPAAVAMGLDPDGVKPTRLRLATVQAMFRLAEGLVAGSDSALDDYLGNMLFRSRRLKRWRQELTRRPAEALAKFRAVYDGLSPIERASLDRQTTGHVTFKEAWDDVAAYRTCVKWTGYRVYKMACAQAVHHGTKLDSLQRHASASMYFGNAQMHMRNLPGW